MPGSIANAAPTTVMPWALARVMVHSREYPVLENDYKNGENQRTLLGATSRKRWSFQSRLTPTQAQALRNFYDARSGGKDPFYIYDVYETVSFAYDATGVLTTGRYVVRFDGQWQQTVDIGGRVNCSVQVVEVA